MVGLKPDINSLTTVLHCSNGRFLLLHQEGLFRSTCFLSLGSDILHVLPTPARTINLSLAGQYHRRLSVINGMPNNLQNEVSEVHHFSLVFFSNYLSALLRTCHENRITVSFISEINK